MPLLDHFHPPLGKRRHWEGFHSAWATCIIQQLNAVPLPERYHAEPQVQLGVLVEADVATFEEEQAAAETANGAVATAVWAPPRPPLVVPVDFAELDVFEVQVFDDETARTLVAVVELVSPSNKDRPGHRQAFATKCAAYLQQNVSVVVVDVVTSRHNSLHAELMRTLGREEAGAAVTSDLYAVAYRPTGEDRPTRLEAWPATLAVGAPLPVLPLWIAPELAVPLDLEASYTAACELLRIRG